MDAALGGASRPVVRCTAVDYAVAVLDVVAVVSAGFAMTALVVLGERDDRWLLSGLASVALLAVACGLVIIGRELAHRQAWAWRAALAIDVVVIVGGVLGVVSMLNNADAIGDAAVYGFVALVAILGLAVFSVVALSAGSTREWLRPPPAGWYHDPDTGGWRWWDGNEWTTHKA